MKYRIVTFLFFALVIIFLTEQESSETRSPLSKPINQQWLDFCITNSSDQIKEASVTLIQIDESYQSALPSENLTRLDYAVILANIEKFKPRSVAIVTPLQWKKNNQINQSILEKQCAKITALTLGAIVENGSVADKKRAKPPYQALTHIEGDISKINTFTRSVAYPETGKANKAKIAFTNIELSKNNNKHGQINVPLVARYKDDIVPSFILMALIQHENLNLDDITLQLPPAAPHATLSIAGKYSIPIDLQGQMKLYQDAGLSPPLYSRLKATNLTLAHSEEPSIQELQNDLETEFQSLSTNLVILGPDQNQDRHITLNNGEKISLAELTTRSIATIQSGRYIDQWSLTGRLLGFVLIILIALKLYQLRRRQVLIWGSISVFLYFSACVLLFSSNLTWSPPAPAFALFCALIIIGIILPYSSSSTQTAQEADNN